MNKKEYLDLLAKELDSMSYKDVKDILDDMEYFIGQCEIPAVCHGNKVLFVLKVLVIPSSSQVSSRTATAFLLS